MRALFVHDHRYMPDVDGIVWSRGQFSHETWRRYLGAFDHLTVMGRLDDLGVGEDKSRLNHAEHAQVDFALMPDSNNFQGFITGHQAILPKICDVLAGVDAVIMRGLSELGWLVFKEAKKLGKPIAVEMVADAFDDLWYHGSMAAKAYAPIRFLRARTLAAEARHIIYVTNETLQRRYPPNLDAENIETVSNVEIVRPKEDVLKHRLAKIQNMDMTKGVKVGLIGHLDNRLKGIDVAVRAFDNLPKGVRLHVLGHGDPSPYGASHVCFDGGLPSGQAVNDWLADLDLYIQPSRQEGLPRAVIEAMAQGLPCIGSNAGGIPELLDFSAVVRRGNAQELAQKIDVLLKNKDLMTAQAKRNFEEAQKYSSDILTPRREAFWQEFSTYVRSRMAEQ